MTDRFVKSWNILARGLRERFPGREVYVGAWAYGPERTPPVREVLEKNLVIGFVSSFPLLGQKQRAAEGVEYYLIAQLAWDPLQDASAVLEDYYRRGFGSAAEDIKKYFELMEQVHYAILERTRTAIGRFIERNKVFEELYTPEVLSQAEGFLRDAAEKAAGGPEVYGKRVAFIQVGLDLTKLQVEILRVMDEVRESGGKATAAVKRAVELCDRREKLLQENLNGFAVGYTQLIQANTSRGGRDDYQGPPSAAFLKAAGLKQKGVGPQRPSRRAKGRKSF